MSERGAMSRPLVGCEALSNNLVRAWLTERAGLHAPIKSSPR